MVERVIALIEGESGIGKSFFVANLHNALIYDTDLGGGLAYADARIKRNGSERVQANSYVEVLDDLKRRQRKLSKINTVVIDHLSTLHQESCIRNNPKDERDFGRSSDIATREWRRLREFCRTEDFNLIATAHIKSKWEGEKVSGTTADAGKNVEGDVSIVLEIRRASQYPSIAWVKKWRRDPEDERGPIPANFPFSLENFERLAGAGLSMPREPVKLCSPEQFQELSQILEVAKLPEGTQEKWLKKAGAESFLEMTAPDVQKCIEYVKELINKARINGKEKQHVSV